MAQYISDKVEAIARAMGGKTIVRVATKRPYTTTVYQSTHNAGGAVMGNDPKTSVVNRYLQCWDVPNVFSLGGAAFPQNITYNYSLTIGALTYWALEAIKNKYLNHGPAGMKRRYTVLALVAGVHATVGLIVLAQSQNASPVAAALIKVAPLRRKAPAPVLS